MDKHLIKYVAFFVVLLLLQLLFFNNVQLSGYINPYVYVLFILILPFGISGWLLLLLAFLLGLTMDVFMNTYGMHTSATLLMAFLRPYILRYVSDRDSYEQTGAPSLRSNGFIWFLKYSFILVLAHHLTLFLIESFTFIAFFQTLLRTILSTFVTLLFILLGLYLIEKK